MKDLLSRDDVRFWWPVIISLIGVAIAWGALGTKVNANTDLCHAVQGELKEQQQKCIENHKSNDLTLTQIQVKLAEIQKDIIYIRQKIGQ